MSVYGSQRVHQIPPIINAWTGHLLPLDHLQKIPLLIYIDNIVQIKCLIMYYKVQSSWVRDMLMNVTAAAGVYYNISK